MPRRVTMVGQHEMSVHSASRLELAGWRTKGGDPPPPHGRNGRRSYKFAVITRSRMPVRSRRSGQKTGVQKMRIEIKTDPAVARAVKGALELLRPERPRSNTNTKPA